MVDAGPHSWCSKGNNRTENREDHRGFLSSVGRRRNGYFVKLVHLVGLILHLLRHPPSSAVWHHAAFSCTVEGTAVQRRVMYSNAVLCSAAPGNVHQCSTEQRSEEWYSAVQRRVTYSNAVLCRLVWCGV